jgi:hypothetical protein
MKKIILSILLGGIIVCGYSQSWTAGTGILYTNPTATRIGIGTTNPTYKLHVNGQIYSTNVMIEHYASGDWSYGMHIDVNRDCTKAFGVGRANGREIFCIMGNGVTMLKKLRAEAIDVKPDAMECWWYDHVFSPDYKLRSLQELNTFVKEKQHLPDIPSEAEVKENGINVFEMNALLLKKTEELTLYIIDLEQRISDIENKKGGE